MAGSVKAAGALGLVWALTGFACSSAEADLPDSVRALLRVPDGFPEPRIPEDNPVTTEKIELGRYLFYDKRLSGNGTQSCASCHEQARAFTDGKVTAAGSTEQTHPRNSPSLTNAVYNASLTWANPILTELESQFLVPIFGEDPVELGVTGREDEVLERFSRDAKYRRRFESAFPDEAEPVHWDNLVRATASFVRSMISGASAFDRFVYEGDNEALSASQKRGLEIFYSERLECHHCHGGFNFTESSVHAGSVFDATSFHNTGLYNIDGQGGYPANNPGLYGVTGLPEDMGKFRAPTLRNVGVTAPYMHDGSIETLEEVVRFYEAGGRVIEEGPYAGDGRASPLKSGLVAGFELTEEERTDLIHFLESLTDETFLTDPRLSDPFETKQ